MLDVEYTTQFKRDLKLAKRQNKNLPLLQKIMNQIKDEESLPPRLRNHALSGNWRGHRELHVQPDWLLVYKLLPENNVVIFVRLGSHSELFK